LCRKDCSLKSLYGRTSSERKNVIFFRLFSLVKYANKCFSMRLCESHVPGHILEIIRMQRVCNACVHVCVRVCVWGGLSDDVMLCSWLLSVCPDIQPVLLFFIFALHKSFYSIHIPVCMCVCVWSRCVAGWCM
jgi:hypothetical protein